MPFSGLTRLDVKVVSLTNRALNLLTAWHHIQYIHLSCHVILCGGRGGSGCGGSDSDSVILPNEDDDWPWFNAMSSFVKVSIPRQWAVSPRKFGRLKHWICSSHTTPAAPVPSSTIDRPELLRWKYLATMKILVTRGLETANLAQKKHNMKLWYLGSRSVSIAVCDGP